MKCITLHFFFQFLVEQTKMIDISNHRSTTYTVFEVHHSSVVIRLKLFTLHFINYTFNYVKLLKINNYL